MFELLSSGFDDSIIMEFPFLHFEKLDIGFQYIIVSFEYLDAPIGNIEGDKE